MTDAIEEIRVERERQVQQEGWDANHDDDHDYGQMAWAAACYAAPETIYRGEMLCFGRDYQPKPHFADAWPWSHEWWKRKDRRRDLIRAAALIVAEIERLDRLKGKANG